MARKQFIGLTARLQRIYSCLVQEDAGTALNSCVCCLSALCTKLLDSGTSYLTESGLWSPNIDGTPVDIIVHAQAGKEFILDVFFMYPFRPQALFRVRPPVLIGSRGRIALAAGKLDPKTVAVIRHMGNDNEHVNTENIFPSRTASEMELQINRDQVRQKLPRLSSFRIRLRGVGKRRRSSCQQ